MLSLPCLKVHSYRLLDNRTFPDRPGPSRITPDHPEPSRQRYGRVTDLATDRHGSDPGQSVAVRELGVTPGCDRSLNTAVYERTRAVLPHTEGGKLKAETLLRRTYNIPPFGRSNSNSKVPVAQTLQCYGLMVHHHHHHHHHHH